MTKEGSCKLLQLVIWALIHQSGEKQMQTDFHLSKSWQIVCWEFRHSVWLVRRASQARVRFSGINGHHFWATRLYYLYSLETGKKSLNRAYNGMTFRSPNEPVQNGLFWALNPDRFKFFKLNDLVSTICIRRGLLWLEILVVTSRAVFYHYLVFIPV